MCTSTPGVIVITETVGHCRLNYQYPRSYCYYIKFSLQDPTVSVITITPGVLVHIKFSVQDPTVSVVTITPGLLVQIKFSVQDPTVSVITITPGYCVHIKFSVPGPTVICNNNNSSGTGTHQV